MSIQSSSNAAIIATKMSDKMLKLKTSEAYIEKNAEFNKKVINDQTVISDQNEKKYVKKEDVIVADNKPVYKPKIDLSA